jgi:BirA family biotin operon repressor/biotin-[acetyl-CoA-carboxylase] ligase
MQIGKKITLLDSVDSTNNFAANLLKEQNAVHGQVILAEEQTNGRGQRGASWSSEGGLNLLMSVVLMHDNMAATNHFGLTIISSLSIIDLLKAQNINAKIKWPNDIYVGDEKICGILIENQIRNGNIQSSVVGIGINVNQTDFQGLPATSINLQKGNFMAIKDLMFSLCNTLEKKYLQMKNGEILNLRSEYHDHLYLLNQLSLFEDENATFQGKINGVTEEGLLLVEKMNRELCSYDLKQIKFVKQSAF